MARNTATVTSETAVIIQIRRRASRVSAPAPTIAPARGAAIAVSFVNRPAINVAIARTADPPCQLLVGDEHQEEQHERGHQHILEAGRPCDGLEA